MLNDIRLSPEQSALLAHAASKAGGTLVLDYRGQFTPANDPVCVGLRATSPGVLLRFGAMVAIALDLPDSLHLQMAARICEDYPGNDASRVYYWPGIICPETADEAELAGEPGPGYWEKGDYS